MMPLTLTRPGVTLQVKRITGKMEVKRHLEKLGFVVGEAITVISEFAGNIIVNVKGTRIALDKALAMNILI